MIRARIVGSEVLRSMAQRAGAAITEVEGSHVFMMSSVGGYEVPEDVVQANGAVGLLICTHHLGQRVVQFLSAGVLGGADSGA